MSILILILPCKIIYKCLSRTPADDTESRAQCPSRLLTVSNYYTVASNFEVAPHGAKNTHYTRIVHTKHNHRKIMDLVSSNQSLVHGSHNPGGQVMDRGSSPLREISSCYPQNLPALDESSPSHFESCRRHPREENGTDFTTTCANLG
jgi:hypothetical protein